jgi:3-dehydrosphinganine reductase
MTRSIERRVRGKHAMVTGGSEGIGFAIARRLVMYGASVTLVARSGTKLDCARARLLAEVRNAKVFTVSLDVSDDTAVARVIGDEVRHHPLDFLFNNAGISRPGYFWDIPHRDFVRQNEINFAGAVLVTRAALPSLLSSSDPHIVNVGSVSSVVASLGHSAYCGSKFALFGFSEVLRAELRLRGVRVSIALPPEVETKMLDEEAPYLPKAAKVLQGTAGKLTPDKVAVAILKGMNTTAFEIVPGFMAKTTIMMYRLAPGFVRAYSDWVVRKAVNQLE